MLIYIIDYIILLYIILLEDLERQDCSKNKVLNYKSSISILLERESKFFEPKMQEAMRVEDGSVRFPDIAAQTTSADTYRHPGLQLSRSKTTLIEPPANYQVYAEGT